MLPREKLRLSAQTRQNEVAAIAQEPMRGAIDALATIEMDEVARCVCTLSEGNFAAGFDSGTLHIYDSDGVVIRTATLDSRVVGLASLRDVLVAVTSTGGVQAFRDEPLWDRPLKSGCEVVTASSLHAVVADGTGQLISLADDGSEVAQAEFGHVSSLTCSPDGVCAAALEDGRLLLLGPAFEVLHDSPAAEDDVETISCMAFRHDGVLLVARNSLGMTVDDRPVNRLECWHPERGMLNTSELPSRATVLRPTESGTIVGCFDGSLLSLDIGDSDPRLIARLDHQVSQIIQWGDDILVASWFDVFRITTIGEVIWYFEHIGVVEHIIPLTERVALMGDDRKGRTPPPLVIIDPDSPPRYDDMPVEVENPSVSEGYSGALSDEEQMQVDMRPNMLEGAESILDTLHEDTEFEVGPPDIESDLLEDLSAAARAINLPPVADAGEDRTVDVDEEGKATVLLDGERSYDPDGSIGRWAWEDGRGNVIGDTPQVRVKLSGGVHVFHLTVTDDRGASSKSTITVQVR
jgi:hypothetical protein